MYCILCLLTYLLRREAIHEDSSYLLRREDSSHLLCREDNSHAVLCSVLYMFFFGLSFYTLHVCPSLLQNQSHPGVLYVYTWRVYTWRVYTWRHNQVLKILAFTHGGQTSCHQLLTTTSIQPTGN